MPHTEHVEIPNGKARSVIQMTPCCPPPIHTWVGEQVNRSGADAQVVSYHGYHVFHTFAEQLTVFYVYLWTCSGIVFDPPSPQPRRPSLAMAS